MPGDDYFVEGMTIGSIVDKVAKLRERVTLVEPNLIAGASVDKEMGDEFDHFGTAADDFVASVGYFQKRTTAIGPNQDAGLQGQLIHRRGFEPLAFARWVLSSTIDVRFFAGFTNQDSLTMALSDNTAGHYFGIQYSTNRGDTKFQVVRKDGTNQFRADDIDVNVQIHNMFLFMDASKVVLQLDNGNRHFFTTFLPGVNVDLRFVIAVGVLAATTKSFSWAKISITEKGV